MVATTGATTHDNVVDFCGIETNAVTESIEHLSKDALWVHIVESTGFFALASW
jgi:hypothetical protein